jgi:ABC-type polysaccharide/polyol phosphate export permease
MKSVPGLAASQQWTLLRELVRRDLQNRFGGTALGFLWGFAQPLWMMLVLTFVFSVVMRVQPPDVPEGGFVPFLLCGLLPWIGFHEAVARSTTAIIDQAALVKRLAVPRQLLVLAVNVSSLLLQVVALLLFALGLAWVGNFRWEGLWWVAAALLVQLGLSFCLGLVFAALAVWFRDLAQVVTMTLSAWFYLTPVLYTLQMVPDSFRKWIQINPLTSIIGMYRRGLLGFPEVAAWGAGLWAVLVALGLVAALAWFRRVSPVLVDEL